MIHRSREYDSFPSHRDDPRGHGAPFVRRVPLRPRQGDGKLQGPALDGDGSTNTSVPVILYSKTPSVDITADVKGALQDLAVAATLAPAAPVSAPQQPATPSLKPTTPARQPATPPKP